MTDVLQNVLQNIHPAFDIWVVVSVVGIVCAFVFGFAFVNFLRDLQTRRRHRRLVLGDVAGGRVVCTGCSVRDVRVLEYCANMTRMVELGKVSVPRRLSDSRRQRILSNIVRAGLSELIDPDGLCVASVRCAILVGLAAGILGLAFSAQLGVLAAIAGCFFGIGAPGRAVKSAGFCRQESMEAHLPEMLDVLALGMRSGMSFDSALAMYTSHFKTGLGRELALVQTKWTSGLERRDDALRKFAQTYDSFLLTRCVETIVRSIRFGTQMADNLERSAAEARATYKSSKEEQIAKAPVKMMIPTATLILPAMLIEVLGPVVLQMIAGGV